MLSLALALVLFAGAGAGAVRADAAPGHPGDDLTRYVDPMVGTLGAGFVFPGPAAPFGMVQLSPDTDGYFAYTGYQYGDGFIRGFGHVHIESMGVHAGGNLPFMPVSGDLPSTDPSGFKSPFDHATESASPGYYRVLLARYGVLAELTAGVRVGMHRYTFPAGRVARVVVDAGHSTAGTDFRADPRLVLPGRHPAAVRVVGDREIEGSAATPNGYTVHFAARFDRPFDGYSTWNAEGAAPRAGVADAEGIGAGGEVSFSQGGTVVAAVGISFVSRDNARANLDAETAELPGGPAGFDALRERTRAAWDDALHAVTVTGGTDADRRTFYTALYHAQQHPNVFTDVNGEYRGHDGAVHTAAGYVHYANFSLWDTYRTQMPLLSLIAPGRYRDMMRTLLRIYDEGGGRLPQWSLMNGFPDYMIGEPALPVIAQGFCAGQVDADIADALYAAARRWALERPRDPSFLDGYVPFDVDDGGASVTLEHAIADFSLALVADRTGRTADRTALLRLAGNYRNLIDPDTRFVRPRRSDGAWMEPYHPELPDGFVEGNGWQYTWLAPHDMAGLIDEIGYGRGGARFVTDRLDTFFSAQLAERAPVGVAEAQKQASLFGIAYYGNQYTPANEHDLQAPFVYNYAGQPWKTQAIVRGLQSVYRPAPDGLPGNDDLGTMSAWYVWTALGLYPQTAGAPGYTIASPVFESASVRLPGGTFTIAAPGASVAGRYVQSARLNGSALGRNWVTMSSLVPGGTLELPMGPAANTLLWSRPDAAPPSMSSGSLAAFGCGA